MKRKTMFKKAIAAGLLLVLFIAGAVWQRVCVGSEIKKYPAVGDFVDLGGYQAHYDTQGKGDIAFVFITGSGTPCAYTDFYLLQNELSAVGQTVTFDHAGSGWSTGAKTARTLDNLVEELAALTGSVCEGKPVVLLCHSLGSLEAIGYAQRYPQKVKGIVFLDSGSPEFYRTDSELFAQILNRGIAFTRIVGVNRLLGDLGFLLPMYGENSRNAKLPQALKGLDKAMYDRFAGNDASLGTIALMNENAAAVLAGPKLGTMPVLVLSSDQGEEWDEVQKQLASWSENSKQIKLDGAEHYLHWSNEKEVSCYLQAVVQQIVSAEPEPAV